MLKTLFNRLVVSLFLTIPVFSEAQIVKNTLTNLNLNIGGVVYDVTYNSSLKKYIAVGLFTSVGGNTKSNLVILNEDFTVNSGITPTFNGKIYSVETLTNGSTHHLVVGGEFSLVNGISCDGLARFTMSVPGGPLPITNPVTTTFNSTWTPLNSSTGKVHDLLLNGTNVIVTGNFGTFMSPSGVDSSRYHIAQFSIITGNLSGTYFDSNNGITGYNNFQVSGHYVYPIRIIKISDGFLVSGGSLEINNIPSSEHFILKYNNIGKLMTNISVPQYDGSGVTFMGYENQAAEMFELNDSIVLFHTRLWGGGYGSATLNHRNGDASINYFSENPAMSFFYNQSEYWNNRIISIHNLEQSKIFIRDIIDSLNSFVFKPYKDFNVSIGEPSPDGGVRSAFKIVNNFLFISNSTLTNVMGQSRSRLAVVCLEPLNSGKMNNLYNVVAPIGFPQPYELDTIVCSGNVKKYSIKPVQYATGYKWSYTGTGVKYAFSSTLNVQPDTSLFLPLNDSVHQLFSTLKSNQIWLKFENNFTPGSLKVEPYCNCNNATDYVYSNGDEVQLIQAPPPSISIADTSYLNCFNATVDLTINSSTAGVTKNWYDSNNNLMPNDTISLIYSDILPASSDYYIAVIQETSGNLCRNTDTAHVLLDIRKPKLAPDTTLFGTWNCYTDSLHVGVIDTSSFNSLPVNLQFSINDTNYFSTQPFYIYNPNPVYFVGTYPINGCSDTLTVPITTDIIPPNAGEISKTIDGTLFTGSSSYLDVLTCTNDSSLFVLSDTSGYQNYWVFDSDTIYDSLDLSIYAPQFIGFSDSVNTNYTLYYGSLNPSNGCRSNLYISFIDLDISQPLFIPFSGNSTYTCSEDSLLLDHDLVLSVSSQGWISGGTSDTLVYATSPGNYIYEIEGFNGCKSFDTVIVNQNSVLTFEPLSDRIVCPNETFTVTAQAQGNETVSYSWNGTLVNQTFTGEGGVDALMIVQANSLSGCSGIDSIYVRITDPITATFSGYAECGGNISIQVTGVNGGAATNLADYSFRFNDQTLFSPYSGNLPNYPVDSFASYPFWIQDSLNCIYELETTITGEILNPITEFLVSTYNQSLDTIYIANINQYAGFDFMEWSSSNLQVNWIQTFDSSALFSYNDTGWVEIQFTGFVIDTNDFNGTIDTCSYPFSKWIYFGENEVIWDDSLSLGVNSIDVYQNPALSGTATVTLNFSLGSQLEYQVYTTDGIGSKIPALCFTGNGVEAISHSLTLPGLSAGNYYINVLTKYGGKQVTLIVQ